MFDIPVDAAKIRSNENREMFNSRCAQTRSFLTTDLRNRHRDYLCNSKAASTKKTHIAGIQRATKPPQPRSIIDGDILFLHSRLYLTTIVMSRMQHAYSKQYNSKRSTIYKYGSVQCVTRLLRSYEDNAEMESNEKEDRSASAFGAFFVSFVYSSCYGSKTMSAIDCKNAAERDVVK